MSAVAAPASGVMEIPLLGAVVAGRGGVVCAVGTPPDGVRDMHRFETTTPRQSFGRSIAYFQTVQQRMGPLAAIGVGTFGRLDRNTESESYGHIIASLKEGWGETDVVGLFSEAFDVPVGFDTDANAAALGEGSWGAAQELSNYVYLSVGKGVDGAVVVNGNLLHDLMVGHIFVSRSMGPDLLWGACNFHTDCLEALISKTGIKMRYGMEANELPEKHPVWLNVANHLARACYFFRCLYAPQRIILGGSIMRGQKHLFPKIRRKFKASTDAFFRHFSIRENPNTFIVPSELDERAGLLGAFLLARDALAMGNGSVKGNGGKRASHINSD